MELTTNTPLWLEAVNKLADAALDSVPDGYMKIEGKWRGAADVASDLQRAKAEAAGLAYELREARAEIARHHRDFERIWEEVQYALDHEGPDSTSALLLYIRNIVG